MDALEMLEGQAAVDAEGAGETPHGDDVVTGYDLVEQSLPDADHKLLARWVQKYKLSDDDPFFGSYLTARVTFASAAAAGGSAALVYKQVQSIPKVIQDAIIAGAGEIRGGVHQAFLANFEDLTKAISAGINAGALASVTAINKSTKKFTDAASALDSGMDKAIIAKRDAVLSQWVQSGSDELNRRINEAVKKERNINLGFLNPPRKKLVVRIGQGLFN